MRVSLATEIRQGPYGGGNQFLRGLFQEFQAMGVAGDPSNDGFGIFLVNSYQDIPKALKWKKAYPAAYTVHRLGPIFSLHRPRHWIWVDRLMIEFAHHVADLVVFQSEWSREQHRRLGFDEKKTPSIVIGNAPQDQFFAVRASASDSGPGRKLKLLASSWSSNPKKGFGFLKYLDEHLDFTRWELEFVGNSDIDFRNIKLVPALTSAELAKKLRIADLFFFGGEDDACSNMLLEALASGLPTLALKSGGNPELVGKGGELFSSAGEIIPLLEKLSSQLDSYRQEISVPRMRQIALRYLEGFQSLEVRHSAPKQIPKGGTLKTALVLNGVRAGDYWYTRFKGTGKPLTPAR